MTTHPPIPLQYIPNRSVLVAPFSHNMFHNAVAAFCLKLVKSNTLWLFGVIWTWNRDRPNRTTPQILTSCHGGSRCHHNGAITRHAYRCTCPTRLARFPDCSSSSRRSEIGPSVEPASFPTPGIIDPVRPDSGDRGLVIIDSDDVKFR